MIWQCHQNIHVTTKLCLFFQIRRCPEEKSVLIVQKGICQSLPDYYSSTYTLMNWHTPDSYEQKLNSR